jgi:hypothetical protein
MKRSDSQRSATFAKSSGGSSTRELSAQTRSRSPPSRFRCAPVHISHRPALIDGASPQTLTTLAENLLREPSNPKFQSFKPTNDAIKKRIVEPPGALE